MEYEIQHRNKKRVLINSALSTIIIAILLSASCSPRKHSQNALDEDVYINTEDSRLFANIRSKDSESPVLLYLHGGPGSPLGVPLFKAYAGHQLENYFIVVYLHQRGIMKSERVPDSTHNISSYISDIHHVVTYLKTRFPGHNIFLLGHSWGGLLSYRYLLDHKNEADKLVAVCTPLNSRAMMTGRVEMLLRWAYRNKNQEAIEDLEKLQNKSLFELKDDSNLLKKWMAQANGGWHRNLDLSRVNEAIDYEDKIHDWLKEQERIETLLNDEILNINLEDSIQYLNTPLLCIAGKEDTDVPWYIVKEEFENYGGKKTFKLFKKSHHMVFIDEEKLFVKTITRFLRTPD